MDKDSREVLNVFDYQNVVSQSVLHAEDDSRVIQQKRDKDILIFRQGGEDIPHSAEWTHLATLVHNQLGGFELVEETDGESFLNDDFDIYEYLATVDAVADSQEQVSFDENATVHRKLQSSPSDPRNVDESLIGITTIRVHFDRPIDIGQGEIRSYKMQLRVDDGQWTPDIQCGLGDALYCENPVSTLTSAPYNLRNGDRITARVAAAN